MARKPLGHKRLIVTPDSSDSDGPADHVRKLKQLEQQVSKIESRLTGLEIFKLKTEKSRASANQRRIAYKIRQTEGRENDEDSPVPFKKPKVSDRPIRTSRRQVPENPSMY